MSNEEQTKATGAGNQSTPEDPHAYAKSMLRGALDAFEEGQYMIAAKLVAGALPRLLKLIEP